MLDQLIESKKNAAEKKRLGRYLLTTLMLVSALALSGVLWSLFAKDYAMGGANLELSAVVAPIPVVKNEPEPEPVRQPEKAEQANAVKETTRQTNTLRPEESPIVPDKISVTPNKYLSRAKEPFKISDQPEGNYRPSTGTKRGTGESAPGISTSTETAKIEKTDVDIPKPPPAIKKIEEPKKSITVSDGVINGKAKVLPKPSYPPAAKAVGAAGAVNVQVTIDEEGNVVAAKAVSGHALLRDAAERAARGAKFSPTLLSRQPVRVAGLIVYNFTRN